MNRQFLNTVLWIVLFVFLLPSSLAVASWNSLPGSRLYTTKLFMEQALVFVIPDARSKGSLQIAYTERRFTDAQRMLADNASVEGLTYLDSQVDVTAQTILDTKDPALKEELAQHYVTKLTNVKVGLEQQKQLITSDKTNNPTPRIKRNPTPVKILTPSLNPTPTPTQLPSSETEDSIDNSIDDINDTIDKLKKIKKQTEGDDEEGKNKPTPTHKQLPTPSPTQEPTPTQIPTPTPKKSNNGSGNN